MTYWQISALVNAVTAFVLAVFIFMKQRNSPAARNMAFYNTTVFVWAISYFFWQSSKNAASAIFWCRALTVGSSFVPPIYFAFTSHLLGRWYQLRPWIILSYTVAIAQVALIGTPLVVNRVEPLFNIPFWPMAGPLYILQIMAYLIFPGVSLYLMWKDYPRMSFIKKGQIRIIMILSFIGFTSGASNYPQWYGFKFYPVLNGLVWLYTILMFYAIVRYKLFEIDTVIHRTLLWLITLLLVILPVGLVVTLSFDWITTLSRLAKLSLTSAVLIFFVGYYSKLKPHIDHLFRRRKYDYYQVLGEIGQKVGSELDINNVIARLFRELKDVLYIRNGLALVQQPGQLNYTEAGSIGYEALLESQKTEKVTLEYQSSLSQWLQTHQKALEREQVEVDPQYESIKQEALAFLNTNSIEVLIPVVMENKVNALVSIGKKENLQAYTIRDIELLENMGRQIGITIDNALHHEDIVEKERLAEELKLGREIQMNLLPREIPAIRGLTVQGLMQPAKEIGGDYYDFITLPSAQGSQDQLSSGDLVLNNIAIVIGDVSGKGVAAGLLMAMAKTAIHTLSQEETSPKQILLRTNTILNKHIGGQKFMTLLYLKWDAPSAKLIYSSAGHEHILIYRANTRQVESIMSGGFMLGMIADIDKFLEEKQLKLSYGDKILLYTDGVTEAENEAKDRFGLDRVQAALEKHGTKPAQELMQAIKDEVYSFIGNHPQYDDITLVVMEAV